MCNAGQTATGGAYARRIYDLFVPVTEHSGNNAAPASDSIDLKPYAGLFFSESTGQPLRLEVAGGKLRIPGGPILDAVAKDRFRNPRGSLRFMSQDQFELHFVSSDLLEVKSMEGGTSRYRRAQPYAPTAEELKAFAGRYTNEETRAVFEMTPSKDGITVRANDSAAFDFRPVDRDTFQRGGMILRFHRNSAGKVAALDYSNPLVRNIKFKPLTECSQLPRPSNKSAQKRNRLSGVLSAAHNVP